MLSNSFLKEKFDELSTSSEDEKKVSSLSPPLLRKVTPPKVLNSVAALKETLSPIDFKKIPDGFLEKLEEYEMNNHPKLVNIVQEIMHKLNLDQKSNSNPVNLGDLLKLPVPINCNKWRAAYDKYKILKEDTSKTSAPPSLERGYSMSRSQEETDEIKINGYTPKNLDYSKHITLGELDFSVAEIQGGRHDQQDYISTCIIEKDNRLHNGVLHYDKLSVDQRKKISESTVAQMQEKFGGLQSGGCTLNATVAWIDKDNNLQMDNTNLGDSTSYYFILNDKGEVVESELLNTSLHKPSDPEERKRIEAAGGAVTMFGCARLDGCIAMSRAIGDNSYEDHGFSHIPDFRNKVRTLKSGEEAYIVIGCDGLTESKSVTEKHLGELLSANYSDFARLGGKFVATGYENGSKDNISGGVFKVKSVPQAFVMNDGHGYRGEDVAKNVGKNYFPTLANMIANELSIGNDHTLGQSVTPLLKKSF